MRIFTSILLFIVFTGQVNSQNLLPNGNFKEEIVCKEYEQDCGPMGWKLTSADPPSYYQEFKKGDSIPVTQWTAIVVKSFLREQYREYLQAPVLCPLLKGHSYTVSLLVKPESYAVKELGIAFTEHYTVSDENTWVSEKPAVIFKDPHYLKDKKHGWLTLSASFIARGDEKYILIGNFLTDKETRLKKVYGKKWEKASYFVQRVSLVSDEKIPMCDSSVMMNVLRKDRYRHTLFRNHFFPEPQSDTVKVSTPPLKQTTTVTQPVLKIPEFIPVYFEFNKFSLSAKAKSDLEKVGKFLLQNPEFKAILNGHTDSIGTQVYNHALSLKRAESVWQYLRDQGISSSQMQYQGMSFHQPAKSNKTAEGRQANRRVEIALVRLKPGK